MATKPSSKPFWATTGDKTEPSGSKKATGWLQLEKPPYQFFNWLLNTIGEFIDYLSGNAKYNIIVGGDSDEQDYATLAAYITDSPAAGDRLLIKADEVLTATAIIPADIEITMLKGNKFTLATNFSPIIQIGSNVKINGELRVENSDTGTIAKGFSINGDNGHYDSLIIENKSTGTITGGVYIEAGAEGNYAQARSINSGAGGITNNLTDNSGNDENHVTVKGDTAISRSRGANKFNAPVIADLTNMTHNHANAAAGGNTLNTPTIANFTNSQHNHTSASTGGNLGFFTSGTKMVFPQPAAPSGWTQDVTHNDKALRVVSGSGGGSGGSKALSAASVDNYTLTSPADIPSHLHPTVSTVNDSSGSAAFETNDGASTPSNLNTGSTGSDGAHAHGLALAYADVIIATKD
jgi:hypothetical protein